MTTGNQRVGAAAGMTRRGMMAGAGSVALALPVSRAFAQSAAPLKIGVLTDLSAIMSDFSGMGTVTSITMAVEDFGGSVNGRPIEVLKGDHLNKPDIGSAIARKWYDEGVTAIFDIGITSVAMNVQNLAREKNKIVIFTSSASSDLTGSACSPNGIHWTFNNYSQAIGAVRYFSDHGAKTWYFLTVDYVYGRNVQRDTTAMIEARGGTVLGSTLHAFDTSDYSSSLLAAQSSKADVIALATTTAHAANIVKQADEFGLNRGQQHVCPLSITLLDVKAIGLESAQGMIETAPYYWDQNDATRAFAERYRKRVGRMPNMTQASAYGAATHYLNAVKAAGTDTTQDVLARMHATPINDFMTHNGFIRADGRVIRDMYILQVKTPAESHGEWDLEKVVGTIPGAEAFQPANPAVCPLIKA
jgi:branched-chain amino acid transport system substrate-binding protein